jgi:hypothetical protein
VSRFARAVEMNEELSKPISITRSGGGLWLVRSKWSSLIGLFEK